MKKIKHSDFESKDQSPKSKVQSPKFKVQTLKLEVEEISRRRLKFNQIARAGLIFLILPNFACVNQSLLKGNKNAAVVVENNVSEYERDLQTMKTANFDYIFVFRRKDGGVFAGEDKKYVKANSPNGTNRFVLTDGDKAVIAGSRYAFSPENLAALRNHFSVEDFSKVEDRNAEKNINANK